MMYKFPFYKKAIVHILEETGIYPQTNNAYDVEVQEPGKTYRISFVRKAEVDLGIKLQKYLTQKQLDEVFSLLEALRDDGYQEALDNCAMEEAGESL